MPAIRYLLRLCFLSCFLAFVAASSAEAVAPTITKCQSIKLKAVGASASGLLGCEGKGIKSGTVVSPACQAKSTGKLSKGIADGDAVGTCPGLDVALQGSTTTFVGDVTAMLHPAGGASVCTLQKLTAVRKHVGKSLKLYSLLKRKPNKPTIAAHAKARDAFARAFAKAEQATDCQTSGDREAVSSRIDAYLSAVRLEINGGLDDLIFDDAVVTIPPAELASPGFPSYPVTLAGTIQVAPNGAFAGRLTAAIAGQPFAVLDASHGLPLTVGTDQSMAGGYPSSVYVPDQGRHFFFVNGEARTVEHAQEEFRFYSATEPDVLKWSPSAKAMLALSALALSPEWGANVNRLASRARTPVAGARGLGPSLPNLPSLPSLPEYPCFECPLIADPDQVLDPLDHFICDVTGVGLRDFILFVGTEAICGSVSTACVGATFFTLGGMAIPCAGPVVACVTLGGAELVHFFYSLVTHECQHGDDEPDWVIPAPSEPPPYVCKGTVLSPGTNLACPGADYLSLQSFNTSIATNDASHEHCASQNDCLGAYRCVLGWSCEDLCSWGGYCDAGNDYCNAGICQNAPGPFGFPGCCCQVFYDVYCEFPQPDSPQFP